MKIEKITRKSHYYNEDRYLINKDFIMVMDGATSLEETNLKPTSGCFLVNKLKNDLPKLTGNIIERLNIIAKDIFGLLISNNELNQAALPSAGLSWVEFINDDIIVHTIGDCEATIITKDNDIIRIVEKDLLRLDDIAISEMISISKNKNISIKDARPQINQTLIKHRLLMNKEKGYSVFAPDSNPNFKYTFNIFKRNDVKEIYLYSDGFADAFYTFNIYNSHKDMFAKSININQVVNKIVKKAFEDKNYNKYPRFKLIDDITVVKITF